jgi:predicted metal-dependent peptidase
LPEVQEVQVGLGSAGGAGQAAFPDFGGTGCVLDAAGEDGKPLTEAERNQLEAEWKIATLQAAQAAKAQGKLPAGLEALADSIRAPQVDWRAVLREFVRSVAAGDYSWARPNVRHLAAENYFPSLYSEETGPLLVGVDTSGSVSQAELDAICAELNGCLDTARPESVDVIYCDAAVAGHEKFKPDDWPVRMAVKGRGGTHLAPIWKYAREHDIDPVCAIVTSDMELCVRDLGDDPGVPVLWLSTGRDAPMDGPLPFGTLVKVEA